MECLKPLFLRQPKAFRPLMRILVTACFQVCKTAGLEADSDLLGDIVPLLSDDAGQDTHM